MEKIKVGTIEGYDVLYLPERKMVFCKNTVLPLSTAKEILDTHMDRIQIESKNMVVRIFPTTIELGCLTTSKNNYKQIYQQIKRLENG